MKTINIITVKWGDKYSSDDVNKIYKMVKKSLDKKFNFYCLTECPQKLNDNIIPIFNDLEDDLPAHWNKLLIFKNDIFKSDSIKLFLDLDIIIQNNIEPLINSAEKNKIKIVKCVWKELTNHVYYNSYNTLNNSSLILWSGNVEYIWDYFQKNQEHYLMKYHGIDRFLEHENIDALHFEEGLIYSRLYGVTENPKDYIFDEFSGFDGHHCGYYAPEYLICLFNGRTSKEHYIPFKKYYA